MSDRRRRPAQRWVGIVAAALAAILAVILLVLGIRLIGGALNMTRSSGAGTPDPQFAEPAETVTRPPEMAGEDGTARVVDDPSAGWEAAELVPVDKTAEELGREEAAED